MEEVSAEKLAEEIQDHILNACPTCYPPKEGSICGAICHLSNQVESMVIEAINKATEEKNRELEAACRQLEFTNNFLKTHMDTGPSRQLVMDNQALIDQIRLER